MTQGELAAKLYLYWEHNLEDGKFPEEDLLEIINQHVREVIGDDITWIGRKPKNISLQRFNVLNKYIKNSLIREQRKRAGL